MKNDLFTEIIGQHTAKLLLTEAIERNQIAPAYLFSSEVEGVGKGKIALAFANAILSRGNRSAIAKHLPSLKGDGHLDILQIKPTYTENTSQQKSVPAIRVEQVREVIEFLSTSAVEGKQKVVIIHEADMLNPTAANKLLKTLEEPKTGTFILISSYPQKLLPTIKSRCQIIPFQRLSDEEVISVLKDQQIEVTEKILAISLGSPGQAIANIIMLASISQEITKELEVPPDDILKALSLSNSISSWNHQTQLWLLTYLQYHWWQKLKSTMLLAKFTQARKQLLHHVTPRSVWDNLLLP